MKILILSTWFPYPLSQGSKIRAYYLIKALSQEHSIRLLSFKDKNLEPSWVEHMKQLCQQVEIVDHDPFTSSGQNTLQGWLSPRPGSVVTSYSPEMAAKVRSINQEWNPDCVFALTYVTGPYALEAKNALKVIDVDNFMSRMLHEEFQRENSYLMRFRRLLSYRKFLQYERWLYAKFNYSIVVTNCDRQAVIELLKLNGNQVGVVPNGVDIQINKPSKNDPVPQSLIFNGALTYRNNYDAMEYFLKEIFPVIVSQIPGARIKITGSTENVAIERFSSDSRVFFTGFLDDIRPAISESYACVVPLRMGGGTRLKILEAMALGTPVVSTSKGAEGLDVQAHKHLLIADDPIEFAEQTVGLLRDPQLRSTLVQNSERLVLEKYDWTKISQTLCNIFDNIS